MNIRKINIITFSLLTTLALSSTANEENITEEGKIIEEFTPAFQGLSTGEIHGDGCTSLQNYSVKVKYEEIDYSIEIFRNRSCQKKNKTYSGRLPADAILGGEWNNTIVIDNGSSADSRSLNLVDPLSGITMVEIDYVSTPVFFDEK